MKNKLWLLLSMSALQLSPLLISTAQADLLDDIKQKKEIVIATEARYAPFEMLEDGKIVGLGKDILIKFFRLNSAFIPILSIKISSPARICKNSSMSCINLIDSNLNHFRINF